MWDARPTPKAHAGMQAAVCPHRLASRAFIMACSDGDRNGPQGLRLMWSSSTIIRMTTLEMVG